MTPNLLETEIASRPGVRLRARADLTFAPQWQGGQRAWSIKDPVSLKYFQLREEEVAILRMLDGRATLADIKRQFERQFAPLRISLGRLQSYIAHLHQSGLAVSDAPGQGEQLLARRTRQRREQLGMACFNLLAIRFRGIDPEPLLARLYPLTRWMFSPWCLMLWLGAVLGALGLAATQCHVLLERLPEFHQFFNPRNILWLMATLGCVKVLHELGHALACKHFGGECHELGLMLLVFTPCLYCNVSDSWMLRNRWRRIAVAAAGMYVELWLAAIATLLWWWSPPGLLSMLCLNVMFICSVSTLLLNGNPLLRYDGYFILSDLVGVPNLGQRSTAMLRRLAARWGLGMELAPDRALPERHQLFLALYGLASLAYRAVVLVGILWIVHRTLRPQRLEVVAQGISALVLVSLALMPTLQAVQLAQNPIRRRQVRRGRVLLSGAILAGLAAALWYVPVPTYVSAPVVLEPQGAQRVYVSYPGTLEWAVAPGVEVVAGQELARLENLQLRDEIVKLSAQRDVERVRLANLESRRVQDPAASSLVPTAKEALADVTERLRQREQQAARLVITAPVDGIVLPPPYRAPQPRAEGQLAAWSGTPLEEHNRLATLAAGTLVCLVGDPEQLEAVLVVSQEDIDQVRVGQRVWLQFAERPGQVWNGSIVELAKTDLRLAPQQLQAEGDLAVHRDESGAARPRETSYQARVVLDETPPAARLGARGWAKITVENEPLGQRMSRYLARVFNFQ